MPVVILTKLPIELTTYVNVTLFKKTFKCNSLTMWLSIFKTAALHWLCHVPLFCLHGIRLIATNSRSVQSHRLTVDPNPIRRKRDSNHQSMMCVKKPACR